MRLSRFLHPWLLLVIIIINDIHLREDTDYVHAIFITDQRAIHVVLAGNLESAAGIMLVSPTLENAFKAQDLTATRCCEVAFFASDYDKQCDL